MYPRFRPVKRFTAGLPPFKLQRRYISLTYPAAVPNKMTKLMLSSGVLRSRLVISLLFVTVLTTVLVLQAGDLLMTRSGASAPASAALSVTPITWNIVGLDSNSPAFGPNRFPVGARVCNTGSTALGNVGAQLIWDSSNANINLRPGSLASMQLGSLAAGSCADAYFEAEVTRTAAAFNTSRRYRITANDPVSGASGSTPQGRELFVEKLISQNRNGVTSIKLNGTLIPGGGSMNLLVGNTYNIELKGYTATQGYNQLEGFINFPNTIFQVLAVNTTYSANNSPYVSTPSPQLYANACLWDDDVNSPNYRSCIGGDAKAGGSVTTTYTVKILSGGGTSQTLNTLLYDFSGSSFHYNADYSAAARVANIISPAATTISKAFSPKAIAPGGTSALTFRISNPTSETLTGVNFTDTFPAGMLVANTPGVSYTGCGAGSFSPAPAAGATSLSFADGTIAPGAACVITVNVTAPAAGTFVNTTGNLFINGSTDTGNSAQDTLVAAAAAACTPGQTLATWTMPTSGQGSGGPPPPYTTKSSRVASAVASTSTGMTNSIATTGNPTNAWASQGFAKTGALNGDSAPYLQFAIDTSNFSGVSISLDYMRDTNWGGGGSDIPTMYIYSSTTGASGSFTRIATTSSLTSSWQTLSNVAAAATGSSTTYFRINAVGTNSVSSSQLLLDNISFTGCGIAPAAPTISKSFAPSQIVKGATTSLAFTLNNTQPGNQALTGVAFTDVLPAGLSVADSSSSQCGGTVGTTASTRTISLTGGQLAQGGSCSFSVNVTGSTEGSYTNVTGFVSTNENGTTTSYATAPLTVVAPPSLGKAFSPAAILTGATSTLSFTIVNPNQSGALTGIDFTDPLPSGVTVATSGPTSACGGTLTTTAPSTISLAGGSLAAGASCSFSVNVTGATSGSKLNTTSTVSSTEGGAGAAATATLIVNAPTAVVDLNKHVSTDGVNFSKFRAVAQGANVYYRFALYNGGDVPLTSLSVSDPLLAGTSHDPAGCTWTLPLAVGDTAYCVRGPVAAAAGSVTNVASASASHSGGNISSAPSTAVYATAGLTIVKDAVEPYFLAAGDVLHYSYLVSNTGSAPLLGPVVITDDKTPNSVCPAVGTVGDLDNYLDPGESINCSSTYTVIPADVTAGSVTNLAFATVSGFTSNTASKTLGRPVDLSISKTSSPKPYSPGDAFTYTVVVTNNGPANVSGANVTDTLPAALAGFIWTCSASGPGASCGTAGPVSGNINALVNLPAGTQAVFTVSGTLPSGTSGPLTNTASIAPPAGVVDIVPGNNTATDVNPVGSSADLAVTKTSSPSPYIAGSPLAYTITVTNGGPSAVTGAVVRDIVPANLSGVTWTSSSTGSASVTNGATGSGNDLAATIDIAAGAGNSVTFIVSGTVVAGTTAPIVNTVTVQPPAGVTDPVPGNNAATDVNGPAEQADLAVTKVSSPNPYVAGSLLSYTVTVTNNGPANVTAARIEDRLPEQIAGFSWTCLAAGGAACLRTAGSGDVDTLLDLPVGSQATFTVSGIVPVSTYGTLTNTVSITTPRSVRDPVPSNNLAVDATNLEPTAGEVSIAGRVITPDGVGIRNALVTLIGTDGVPVFARTSAFGYYRLDEVPTGGVYLVVVTSKAHVFTPRLVRLDDAIEDFDFIGMASGEGQAMPE